MVFRSVRFPLFRRSIDGRHFYRLDSPRSFVEVQIIGRRKVVHEVVVRAYPEQVLLHDLITMNDGRAEPISQAEFDEVLGAG